MFGTSKFSTHGTSKLGPQGWGGGVTLSDWGVEGFFIKYERKDNRVNPSGTCLLQGMFVGYLQPLTPDSGFLILPVQRCSFR